MEAFLSRLANFRKSYKGRGVVDNSSIQAFQRSFHQFRATLVSNTNWAQKDIQQLVDIIKGSYDCSNEILALFRSKDYNPEVGFQVCLRIRMICSEVLQLVIIYINSRQQILKQMIYKELLFQMAFEILVLTTRMCLDTGTKHLSFARKISQQTRLVFNNAAIDTKSGNFYIYCLNDIEMYQYEPESKITLEQIKDKVSVLLRISLPQYQDRYEQYIGWILMRLAVKLLKRGDKIEWLHELLPAKQLKLMKGIYSSDRLNCKEAADITGVPAQYYELFIQVRKNGFSNTTEEYLKEILQQTWNQKGFFEVLAQNYSQAANPLRIWFKCHNDLFKKATQDSYLSDALKFFISLVEHEQSENSTVDISSMVQLIKEVLCSLVGCKKPTQIPVNPAIRSVVVLIRQLVIANYPNQPELLEIFQTLKSLIQAHSFPELIKDLAAIQMFYLLPRNSHRIEEKFIQYLSLSPEQSQLKHIIVTAYESIMSQSFNQDAIDLVKNQPALSYLLFESRGIKTLLLADSEFLSEFEDIFGIFAQVLGQQNDGHFVVERLTGYLGQATIKYTQKAQQQLDHLIHAIVQRSKQAHQDATTVYQLMLAACFCEVFQIAKELGIPEKQMSHTKFHRISLYLSQILERDLSLPPLCQFSISLLSSAVAKLSINLKQGKWPLLEVGQFAFYELLQRLLTSKQNAACTDPYTVKLLIFQLRSLDNQNEYLAQQVRKLSDVKLLNLYSSCNSLSNSVKIQIVRKMIFMGMSSGNSRIRLDYLKTAILHCNDPEQRVIYSKHILYLYNQEGKKFLQSICQQFPQLQLRGVFRSS